MAEEGIDMSAAQPKILTTEAVKESDVVITMGCGDACPMANAMRTGSSTIPQVRASTPSGPFVMRSGHGSST